MHTLMPLAVYAFVASITPGPNNLMLTSSGLRFGFTRTIPHILGITVGFCTLAIALFCLVFGVVNIGCVSVWAGTGAALRDHLREPRWQKAFCTVMMGMTVYAAASIWR